MSKTLLLLWILVWLLCVQICFCNDVAPGAEEYQKWIEYIQREGISIKDVDPAWYYDNSYFKDLVKVGVPAVPLLIDKVQENHLAGYALHKIVKKDFRARRLTDKSGNVWCVPEFSDMQEIKGPPDHRVLWKRWWEEGRKETPGRFNSLYEEWKQLKSSSDDDKAQESRQKIQNLGIDVLPLLMDKIIQGDKDLISVVSHLTESDLPTTATTTQAMEWWGERKSFWQLPPAE